LSAIIISTMSCIPQLPPLLELIMQTIFGEYKLRNSCNCLQPHVLPSILGSDILLSTMFSKYPLLFARC
jgi:hypothetical protein